MKDFVARCRGASAALPTPFRLGRLDAPALQALARRLVERGIATLVPGGPTGEGGLLAESEHREVVEATLAAAAGRVPVIAGVGSSNTRTALNLARAAEAAGATALLALTPFHLRPTQAGNVAHFRTLHDAVGIPVVLYDAPQRTGIALDDATIAHLAALPRVAGLVDATGDIARLGRLRRRLGGDFLLLTGDDRTQAAYRTAGGDGCLSVTANVAPALSVALQRACEEALSGDISWYEQLLAPLGEVLSRDADVLAVKRALSRLSLMGDGTRLTQTPLDPAFDRRLQAILEPLVRLDDKEARRLATERPHGAPRAA
jgi:4-hydroxy-tetrahydrodipicolinate synthase